MGPVESSVVIKQPIEVCFAYLSDLGNDVEWRREWVAAEKTSEGPAGVGARYRLTTKVLDRPAATVYEAIAYESNRLAAWWADRRRHHDRRGEPAAAHGELIWREM